MAGRPSRPGAVPVHSLLDHLRGELPSPAFSMCFGVAEERGDGVLALPNEFVRGVVARRYDDELRRWAESTGVSSVELVVDVSIAASRVPDAASESADVVDEAPPAPTLRFPPGVTTRLLAERGFWSLSPGQRAAPFAVDDLRGSLAVEPSRRGAPGVYEATVFTGLLTLWAGGDRREPVVRVSLRRLCALLDLSWSGKTAAELRAAIEKLKTTTYRMTFTDEVGGRERLFSLLDEIETQWQGPATTPHRAVRAVFSRMVFEQISQPRILRPVDLAALKSIGHRRDLARRLFLFLEGQPGHEFRPGLEVLERVVDARLAATLGCSAPLWRVAGLLRPAGGAICDAVDRYERAELVPRRKRMLEVGEPRWLLRVVRRRVRESKNDRRRQNR